MFPKLISNEELTTDDLPNPSDRRSIFQFAMSFNGFEYYGSFEACAEAALSSKRNNLTEIRNELFFAARASRHCEDDLYLERYKELLPLIRKHLSNS